MGCTTSGHGWNQESASCKKTGFYAAPSQKVSVCLSLVLKANTAGQQEEHLLRLHKGLNTPHLLDNQSHAHPQGADSENPEHNWTDSKDLGENILGWLFWVKEKN